MIIRDYTGQPCKHCGVILTHETHSNRSKISASSDPKRTAWRICKNCLKVQKARTRDREQARAYSKKFATREWHKTLANACSRRARDTGVICTIDGDAILEKFAMQNGKCYWFGVNLIPSDKKKSLTQPSIDRLDPSGPYTPENCVIASYFANIGRQNASVDDWKEIVEKMKTSIRKKYA